MSWPESSTCATSKLPEAASSERPDSMKLVETSLTIDKSGWRVDKPPPLMCTLQRVGSHEGGLTS